MPEAARRSVLLAVALAVLAGLPPAPRPAADPPIRLIVRGDDMGSSQASNEAAVRCFRDGVMRDVELMAVGPWFPEAARLLRENPGLDVGLHLTLTSEWDNVKWRPLTTAPSLVGKDGYFHPMIWPHPHYGKERALKEQAVEARRDRARAAGPDRAHEARRPAPQPPLRPHGLPGPRARRSSPS